MEDNTYIVDDYANDKLMVKEPIPKRVEETDCCFAPELDWFISLLPDKSIIKVRDVIKYRIEKEEYTYNKVCHISCGKMLFIIDCIDVELRWRREKGIKVEY